MSARKIAYKVLMDIEINKNYSNISLNSHLDKENIDDRDRGLVTELVYGVIENKRYIDYMINKVSKIKVRKMEHSVKTILRMGVYQLVFLDRVADYAAINESVNMMKKIDKKSSNFVNAVLRNVSRQKEEISKIKEDTADNIAIKYSYEKWIVDRLIKEYGKEKTKSIIKALDEKPKLYIRVNKTKSNRHKNYEDMLDFVISNLEADQIVAKRVEGFDEALEVENFKNIEKNIMFRKGYISIQDISSMMVAKVLDPKEGSRVLDLCAAPGGKSTHIAEMMNNTGKVLSQDIYDHKIKLIDGYSKRLGLKNIISEKSDATVLNDEYIEKFDYVLSDVPCSGMGIVRRKPEIKYKSEEDVNNLPDIQMDILKNASKYVKKGGILLYSTCTMFKEENIDIIKRFLEENKNFTLEPINNIEIKDKISDSGYVNIYPDESDMDGFFICKMKKI
ncbi:MAG: 16S rRNA (cytosine(967)-C(5))-methyltransferase RsmB [Peptostreptococcus sp.]|uniref:16S rRNA (cytosine(967)-C(5))-methyltransferase RsmB n=1 Tax=Peptostreptococcus sp. TaxID=1262 RepID=UPI002FC6B692